LKLNLIFHFPSLGILRIEMGPNLPAAGFDSKGIIVRNTRLTERTVRKMNASCMKSKRKHAADGIITNNLYICGYRNS